MNFNMVLWVVLIPEFYHIHTNISLRYQNFTVNIQIFV